MDAIVLAGGAGSRLGGVDKAALVIGDKTMLERALEATRIAVRTVVVGPRRSTERPVTWTQESPTGGGPVAAVAAGLQLTSDELVAIVAVDLPHLVSDDLVVLAKAAEDRDGAILVDGGGRDQFLAGVYRATSLRAALDQTIQTAGAAMHVLVQGLDLGRVVNEHAAQDCDTPEDLESARATPTRR